MTSNACDMNGEKKGRRGPDVTKLLPTIPMKRTKPAWAQNPPSFTLDGKPKVNEDAGIELIYELTASIYSFSYHYPTEKPISISKNR